MTAKAKLKQRDKKLFLQPKTFGKGLKIGRTILGCLLFAIIPIVSFLLVEFFTHDPREMDKPIQNINMVFYLILLLFLFGLTGRMRIAAALATVLAFLIGFGNSVVLALRGSPVLPWDFLSLNTALSVSDNYKLPINTRFWLLALAAAVVLAVAMLVRLNLKNVPLRVFLVASSLVLMFGYAAKLHDTAFTDQYDFDDTLFTPVYLYRQNGFAASFVINLKYLQVPEPEGYSVGGIDQAAAELEAAMAGDPDVVWPSDLPPGERPNILVIMDEAFADLSMLADFDTNEDYMPFFRSLTDNVVRGNLHVSIIGGNTATTEFEFLTGSSMAFLPAGSVAYQQYINGDLPGLPSTLENLGYQTVAMHPYLAGGWDRDEVYPSLGFDQIFFEKDFSYRQKLRQYVSDRSVFRQLIKSFERKPSGTPLFGFAVTMQNHGGYGTEFANFKPTIKIEEPGDSFKPTEHYLSLIKESDLAFQDLIEYFASVDEKTVILFFGDHQPNDYIVNPLMALEKNADAAKSEDYTRNRYVVPYLIWANYDIAERQDVTISANFLSALLLETAGVAQTPFAYFLSNLQSQIPVMTATHWIDPAGASGHYEQADDAQKALLHRYALLQYNLLFDRQGRRISLFE